MDKMADDAYEVVGGSLKLKGVTNGGIKKKKKKNKAKKLLLEQPKKPADRSGFEERSEDPESSSKIKDDRTPAQIAYDKMQEKRAAERILAKASQSHKERVALLLMSAGKSEFGQCRVHVRVIEFNAKLDNLTEHYDIPKVSWTK